MTLSDSDSHGFVDADWAGDADDRRSTNAYVSITRWSKGLDYREATNRSLL